jgi:endonuclease YncB( thermonuclease family)
MSDNNDFYITDGDTFNDPEHGAVRVRGVDTPENTPKSGMHPGGWQATEATRYALRNGYELGPQEGTTYGRGVHDVTLPDGERLSDTLIRNGLGSPTGFSDPQNDAAFAAGVADDLFNRPASDPYYRELRDSARRQQADRLAIYLNGGMSDRVEANNYKYLGEEEGTASRAWDRGVAELRATGNAFIDVIGGVVGSETLRERGRAGMEEAMLDAARNPANVASWEEVDGLADVGMFGLEAVISEGPSLVVDALAGLTSGGSAVVARRSMAGIGKALLRNLGGPDAAARAGDIADQTFRRAAAGGAFGSMYVQESGGTHMEQLGVGVDDPDRALMVGLGKTTLEYASLRGILGDVVKRFDEGENVDSIASWFGSTLATTATGVGREGVTELTQALIGELNKVDVTDGEYELDPDRLIEGLVAGGFVGGTLSGAGAAVGNTYQLARSGDRVAGNGPVQEDTKPEPLERLAATIESRPDSVTYISPSNANDGATLEYLRERYPNLHAKQTDNGGVKVSLSPDAVASASTAVDEATQAQELGIEQPKDEVMAAAAEGKPVVMEQRLDSRGQVIHEQLKIDDPNAELPPNTRRVPVQDALVERDQEYREQVEAFRASRPAQPAQPDVAAGEGYQTGAQRRAAARFEFEPDGPVPDAAALVGQAADAGIDTSRFVAESAVVNENLLRRDLQSRLSDIMPGRDVTLRDALDGRKLSELDSGQLRQLAEAMGVKDLPKKATAFDPKRGTPKQQRLTAINAVANKIMDWRNGTRLDRGKDGIKKPLFVDQFSPSDMSMMAGFIPGIEGLDRTQFDSSAAYQEAVRDALHSAFPTQQALRQHLASLDDASLIEAVQMTRADDSALGFQTETDERALAGRLQQAVTGEQPTAAVNTGERRKYDKFGGRLDSRLASSFGGNNSRFVDLRFTDLNADAATINRRRAARADLDNEWDAAMEGENPIVGDPPNKDELISAAAAASLYAELTGQNEGPGYRSIIESLTPSLASTPDKRQALKPSLVDGKRLLARIVQGRVDQAKGSKAKAEARTKTEDELRQAALDNPREFAQAIVEGAAANNLPLANYLSTPDTNRRAKVETASASGVSNTRLQDRGEQESSDYGFFVGLIDGARFGRKDTGELIPARPLDAKSDLPEQRQRLESLNRSLRHQKAGRSNLLSITVGTRFGEQETYLFDAVALSNYAQSGYSKPDSPAQAYTNLLDNISRLANGPQTAEHRVGGQWATYVQSLTEFPFIPEHVVVYEGSSGAVTYGEARRAYYQERSDNQLRADLARELDEINERQADRRRALRSLINRALNGLSQLGDKARLATVRDINDALYQTDNDSLESFAVATETLTDAEFGDLVGGLQDNLALQKERLAKLDGDMNRLQRAADLSRLEAAVAATDYPSVAQEAEQVAVNEARTLAAAQREADGLRVAIPRREVLIQELTATRPNVQSQRLDTRGVSNYDSVAGQYALTDQQSSQFPGTQGTRSLTALLSDYRRERERATTLGKELDKLGRLPSYTDRSVDLMTDQITQADGMDRDSARQLAEQMVARAQGLIGSEAEGRAMDSEAEGDVSVDGNKFSVLLDENGNQVGVDAVTNDDTFVDGPSDERDDGYQNDEASQVVYEALSFKQQLRKDLEQRTKAFFEATGRTPMATSHKANFTVYKGEVLDQDAVPRAPMMEYTNRFVSEAHKLAYQKAQAAKRVQASGIPLPETPRPAILNAAFGDKGVRVVGAQDGTAVEAFVTQATKDFRSTGRPVLVMVGESADRIGQFLGDKQLLKGNQRSSAVRKLRDADAGKNALYMPMGDFVLVSLPTMPKRGRAANLRWYHQLGHELGHMVFDDYAQSLASNRAQRDAVYAAFESFTGVKPEQDPTLFKEWFADQAANEMIDRSLGMADPEQVTPFTRLANLLQGLWERIQYLIPRMTRTRSFAQFAVAIRAGQIQRRENFEATEDFAIENYDGAKQANKARLLNTKLKTIANSHTGPGTVAESMGRFVRTVIGRIESYSPELASHLFQRSATDRNSRNQAAWQQATNANRDRWVGSMERAFQEVYKAAGIKGAFKGKEKQAAIIEAFRDFEAGRTHKRGAAALAEAMRGITQNARQNGFRSMPLDGSRPPVAFDHHKVDADRQAFSDLMREAFPEASDHELGQRLGLLLDSQGQSEFAIAPGLPVSYHDTTRHMVEAIGADRLRELGFLAEPSDAVFYHFIDGLAKRTAWEANFGDYTDTHANPLAYHRRVLGIDDPNGTEMKRLGLMKHDDPNQAPRYYNPNGQFHRMMESIVAEHGQAARKDILDMLDGVMGRKTSNMPRGLRNINDWVTAWVSWTVLAFSGIASIPEIGLGAVRAHGRVGILDGVRGYREARQFAKAAGNVLSDSAERIMWQSMGDNYESSTLNKIGTAFFKYNGQQAITNVSRIMGISFGTQYLLRSAEIGDTQALQQLGVTAEDVRNWDKDGRPVWTPGADPSVNATAEKVQAALTQFMYEGSSYPSKFQNPGWFNNPYLKAFWMIKRYMYAYGEGILMGMWRQAKRQWMRGQGLRAEQKAFMVAAPFMAFAVATIPLAMLGTEIREWMRPLTSGRQGKDIDDYGGVAGYSQYLFSRAGGFGPLEMVLSARQQSDWGYSPLGSVSPVAAKMEMLLDWGADTSFGDKALDKTRQMLPIANQFPGVWNKIVP